MSVAIRQAATRPEARLQSRDTGPRSPTRGPQPTFLLDHSTHGSGWSDRTIIFLCGGTRATTASSTYHLTRFASRDTLPFMTKKFRKFLKFWKIPGMFHGMFRGMFLRSWNVRGTFREPSFQQRTFKNILWGRGTFRGMFQKSSEKSNILEHSILTYLIFDIFGRQIVARVRGYPSSSHSSGSSPPIARYRP